MMMGISKLTGIATDFISPTLWLQYSDTPYNNYYTEVTLSPDCTIFSTYYSKIGEPWDKAMYNIIYTTEASYSYSM